MLKFKREAIFLTIASVLSVALTFLMNSIGDNPGLGDVVFFIVIFFIVILFFLVKNLWIDKRDPLELINPFLIIFTLYTMMLPINALFTEKYMAPMILYQYMIVALVGLVALLSGYYLFKFDQVAKRLPKIELTDKTLQIGGWCLLMIGLFSFYISVQNFGGLATFFSIGYGPHRYLIMRSHFTFGYGWEWIGLALTLFLLVAMIRKSRKTIIVILIFIAIWMILSFWLGYRRPIVYFLIIIFLCYNYLFKKIKLWPVLLTVVLLYFFLIAYGYTRSLLPKFGVLKALGETFSFAVRHPDLAMPVAAGEFNLVAKSITEILSSESVKLKYGESYLVGLLTAIPGVGRLLPGSLLDLGEWRVTTFYPGLYEQGAGLGFHTLAEGLINFGIAGVFLHMFLYGLILRISFVFINHNRQNIFIVLGYAVTVPVLLFDGIRSDFTSSFFKWSHCYFGPLILILIAIHYTSKLIARKE